MNIVQGNKLVREIGKKIVAVGKNYQKHVVEMGGTVAPKDPVLFLKPTTSYVIQGQRGIVIPPGIGEVHHELELGVVIGETGGDIPMERAMDHVAGYVLSLDMTARDLQWKAKEKGLPWSVSKGYNTFSPISDFLPKDRIPNPEDVELWLKVDGALKQQCRTADMIHKLPFLIHYISSIMTLERGDLIMTGTPEGVGKVEPGQTISAGITDVMEMSFPVVSKSSSHS